jgi:DNA uptake protein ComE-like DNA-binding protein
VSGEKLAENIVLYRSENGPFENRTAEKKYRVWAKSISKESLSFDFEC